MADSEKRNATIRGKHRCRSFGFRWKKTAELTIKAYDKVLEARG